jgi:cysteinyl-tRNA synthetase
MHEDVNVAGAIAAINSWINATPSPTTADAELLRTFDAVLGVLELERAQAAQTEIGVFLNGLAPDPAIEAKLIERRDARAAKNFKRSDEIRDELASMGYAIKDMAGGKVEVRRA